MGFVKTGLAIVVIAAATVDHTGTVNIGETVDS